MTKPLFLVMQIVLTHIFFKTSENPYAEFSLVDDSIDCILHGTNSFEVLNMILYSRSFRFLKTFQPVLCTV